MAERIEFGGGCEQLREAASLPAAVFCCGSCHHEWDDGYGEPAEVEFEGKEYHACCAISTAFDKRPPATPPTAAPPETP